MAESIFNTQAILSVTPEIIDDLKQRAEKSPYRRFRLCMHYSVEDLTQEMIIVCCGDSYMPPHRHPKGKSESYHVMEGSMTVYFFDDDGKVRQKLEMAAFGSGKPCIYRLSEPTWHMPVPSSEWLVYHETYSGPFDRDVDVEPPEWLPDSCDGEAVARFIKRVKAT